MSGSGLGELEETEIDFISVRFQFDKENKTYMYVNIGTMIIIDNYHNVENC